MNQILFLENKNKIKKVPGVTLGQRKRVEGLNKDFFLNFNFWNCYMIFRFIASSMIYKFCYSDNPFKSRASQT